MHSSLLGTRRRHHKVSQDTSRECYASGRKTLASTVTRLRAESTPIARRLQLQCFDCDAATAPKLPLYACDLKPLLHKHANIKKGTRWVPFDKATTKKLEDAFSKHGPESGLHHVYVSATHVVDLKEMTQKNVQTGYSRRILREVVKLPGAEAEFMALVSQFSRDVAPLAKQLVGTFVTLLGILLKLGMKLVDVGRQLFNERTADMREAAAAKKQRALRAAAAKARATADALDAAARAG